MANDPNPVVSIIVPARNEEACLAACLYSLIAQTGIDYEIIVVDDASTDRTPEIARSFSKDHVAAGLQSRPEVPLGIADRTLSQCATTHGKGTTSSRAEQDANTIHGTAKSRALPAALPNDTALSTTAHVGEDDVHVHVRPAVHLISAPPLPANWTGKNNAMAAGAKIAKGKWLLFTDADTVHKPGSLARAVAEAEEHGADLVSYSPEQEVRTFREKAVMPVIFAELATTYPPQAVNDPASPIAAANGQYLMIWREAYDAVGGHAAVAADLLEDVAMARLVKRSGRKLFFRYGGDAVRTRMYRSFAQLREGWTKNLALLFPRPRALALLRSAEFVLIIGNLAAAIWASLSGRSNLALQTMLLAIILAGWFWMRIRKAHFPGMPNLLAIAGLPWFAYLLWFSDTGHRKRSVVWKNREYRSASPRENGITEDSYQDRASAVAKRRNMNPGL